MVDDIKKKSGDLERIKGISCDVQRVLNVSSDNTIMLILKSKSSRITSKHTILICITFQEYEIKSNTYRGTLNDDDDDEEEDEDDNEPISTKRQVSTMGQAVQRKVQL